MDNVGIPHYTMRSQFTKHKSVSIAKLALALYSTRAES